MIPVTTYRTTGPENIVLPLAKRTQDSGIFGKGEAKIIGRTKGQQNLHDSRTEKNTKDGTKQNILTVGQIYKTVAEVIQDNLAE